MPYVYAHTWNVFIHLEMYNVSLRTSSVLVSRSSILLHRYSTQNANSRDTRADISRSKRVLINAAPTRVWLNISRVSARHTLHVLYTRKHSAAEECIRRTRARVSKQLTQKVLIPTRQSSTITARYRSPGVAWLWQKHLLSSKAVKAYRRAAHASSGAFIVPRAGGRATRVLRAICIGGFFDILVGRSTPLFAIFNYTLCPASRWRVYFRVESYPRECLSATTSSQDVGPGSRAGGRAACILKVCQIIYHGRFLSLTGVPILEILESKFQSVLIVYVALYVLLIDKQYWTILKCVHDSYISELEILYQYEFGGICRLKMYK